MSNTNDKLRQEIMGIKATYWHGGTEKFNNLSLSTLNELIENNFVDLDLEWNDAPTARAFLEFVKQYADEPVWFHGYIVSPERDDYRLTIEGIEGNSENFDFMLDFSALYSDADEFVCEAGY